MRSIRKLIATSDDFLALRPSLDKVILKNNRSASKNGYGMSLGSAQNPAAPLPIADPQFGSQDYRLERGGGVFLSSQTGGFTLADTNDISFAIEQVLNDSNSYYL